MRRVGHRKEPAISFSAACVQDDRSLRPACGYKDAPAAMTCGHDSPFALHSELVLSPSPGAPFKFNQAQDCRGIPCDRAADPGCPGP